MTFFAWRIHFHKSQSIQFLIRFSVSSVHYWIIDNMWLVKCSPFAAKKSIWEPVCQWNGKENFQNCNTLRRICERLDRLCQKWKACQRCSSSNFGDSCIGKYLDFSFLLIWTFNISWHFRNRIYSCFAITYNL